MQRVTPGTQTTVVLYKDQSPGGSRKIKGHFKSATPEAITLLLPGGRPYTLQKQAVRKVLVYRPLKKRYQGWVGVAISTAVWAPRIATADDVGGFWGKFLLNSVFIGVPTVIAFLVAPKMGGIYNVPPDLRDPSNTGIKPPQNRSSKTVPEVKESEESPTGSGLADRFLNKESGPELLRQQARQALLRKGLPLRLPDLTVRGLAAERTGMQTTFDGSFPQADEVSRRAGLD